MNVTERLRALMKHVPWLTARALETYAGCKRTTVTKILDGTTADPRGTTLSGLARTLGCTVSWLVDGDGDEPSARRVAAAVLRARDLHHARSVGVQTTGRKVRAGSVVRVGESR